MLLEDCFILGLVYGRSKGDKAENSGYDVTDTGQRGSREEYRVNVVHISDFQFTVECGNVDLVHEAKDNKRERVKDSRSGDLSFVPARLKPITNRGFLNSGGSVEHALKEDDKHYEYRHYHAERRGKPQ